MSKSKAQKFAQQRNSHGGLLKGVIKNLNQNIRQSVVGPEEELLDQALNHLEQLYEDWSNNYEQAKKEHV